MIAEILDEGGNVLNRVVADADFLDEIYPGAWRTWIDPAALELAREAKAQAVDDFCAMKLSAGFPYDFGAPTGIKVLQTRESDKPNWLALAQVASVLVAQGQSVAPMGSIRTADNTNVPVTAEKALTVMLEMQSHLASILERSWALKDAIIAATDQTALDAIDITADWPA